MCVYDINETVWFDGQKWEIADHHNGSYLLWRRPKSGKAIEYGRTKDDKPDPECPFFEGWVPAAYLGKLVSE